MSTGELLTRGTAWLAFVGYVLAVASSLREHRSGRTESLARWTWTIGCVVYVVHVLCAFQFYHHWSHAAAYRDTARQTAESVGVNWGGGLYLNYVFTIVWVAHVIGYWSRSRSGWTGRTWPGVVVHAFLAFMWFNATVVFGHGWMRWLAVVAWAGLSIVWWGRRRTGRKGQNCAPNRRG